MLDRRSLSLVALLTAFLVLAAAFALAGCALLSGHLRRYKDGGHRRWHVRRGLLAAGGDHRRQRRGRRGHLTVPAGTYTLSIAGTGEDAAADGDLDVTDDVTVTGSGAGTTTIDGNSGVTGEAALQVLASNALLADLTITNGGAAPRWRIHNLDWSSVGSLILTNVTVSSNAAFNGAGIANDGGTLTINNSTISGNATTGNSGGGIVNDSGILVLNAPVSAATARRAPTAPAGALRFRRHRDYGQQRS